MDRSRRLSEGVVPGSVSNLYKVDDAWSSTKTFMLIFERLILWKYLCLSFMICDCKMPHAGCPEEVLRI